MTATEVDGHQVVDATPVKSPLWRPDKEVFFHNTLELMLDDGTVVMGCKYCDYTDEKIGRIRTHQSHYCLVAPRSSANPANGPDAPPAESTEEDVKLGDLIAQLLSGNGTGPDLKVENGKLTNELIRTRRERDKWKKRALRSEQDLAPFRALLKRIQS